MIGGAGAAPAGRRVPTLASHIDLLPTMLDFAGMAIPLALEGQSLAPSLHGAPGAPDRSVFVEFNRFAAQGDAMGGFHPMRAVVKGDYKLAIHLNDIDELYDRSPDPAEVRNRIEPQAS